MSISKVIILNFSDGTNTIYTRQSSLYIPFEVDNFKVVNTYSYIQGASVPVSYSITSDLVQSNQNFLTLGRQFTSCNPTEHIYNIPRPINGTYSFTANFSNTLNDFTIVNNRVGYQVTGSLIHIVDPSLILLDGIGDRNYLGSDIIGKQIKTGAGLTLGVDLFNIIDFDFVDSITIAPPIGGSGDNKPIGTNWTIVSNLLTLSGANYYFGAGTFIKGTSTTIISKIDASRYRLNISDYLTGQTYIFNVPQLYNFFDLTRAEIAIDIEFYEKFKLYEGLKIQNYQYVLWTIDSSADVSKYIDIPFPVDEIEITNADMVNDTEYPIYGYYSNLVNSSSTDQDLINKNYTNGLFFNSYTTSHYQTNKKKFLFSNPRFFSGQYNIYSRFLLNNTTNDITSTETVYFQIKFLQYRKEQIS